MKKVLSFIIINIFVINSIFTSYATSNISLGMNKIPRLDVMYAIDNKSLYPEINTNTIDSKLETGLKYNAVDTKDTSIVSTETSEITAESANFVDVVDRWDKIGANKVDDTLGGAGKH